MPILSVGLRYGVARHNWSDDFRKQDEYRATANYEPTKVCTAGEFSCCWAGCVRAAGLGVQHRDAEERLSGLGGNESEYRDRHASVRPRPGAVVAGAGVRANPPAGGDAGRGGDGGGGADAAGVFFRLEPAHRSSTFPGGRGGGSYSESGTNVTLECAVLFIWRERVVCGVAAEGVAVADTERAGRVPGDFRGDHAVGLSVGSALPVSTLELHGSRHPHCGGFRADGDWIAGVGAQ